MPEKGTSKRSLISDALLLPAHAWNKGDDLGFCTVINCMDGRTQLPVIRHLQQRFAVEHVDSITEAGPNLILAEQKNSHAIQSILDRISISIEHHASVGIAVVGHHGCAGNPAPRDEQLVHIQKAIEFLSRELEGIEMIGLWVDAEWQVHEVHHLDQSPAD